MNNDFMFEDEGDEEVIQSEETTNQNAGTNTYQDMNQNVNQNANPNANSSSGSYGSYTYNNYNSGYRKPGEKRTGTGPATASLILGIVSLVLFCSCINVVTAIIAIILGANFLANYDLKEGKVRAIVGIATASISVLMLYASFEIISKNDNIVNFLEDDYFKDYYNEFYDDDFYDDFNNYDDIYNFKEYQNDGDFLDDFLNDNNQDDTL